VQQSPWLAIVNKQLELMGRYMAEPGMAPAGRSRVAILDPRMRVPEITFTTIYEDKQNETLDRSALETVANGYYGVAEGEFQRVFAL
jgi:hypothetical protein